MKERPILFIGAAMSLLDRVDVNPCARPVDRILARFSFGLAARTTLATLAVRGVKLYRHAWRQGVSSAAGAMNRVFRLVSIAWGRPDLNGDRVSVVLMVWVAAHVVSCHCEMRIVA